MIFGGQLVEHGADVAEGLASIIDQLAQALGGIRRTE